MASISPAPIDSTPRAQEITEPTSDKISAYYSLVFPNITYYLQTLSVTIGRRCLPNINLAATSLSESQQIQVDVDLGPLKSVSRLHAKIEWQEEEERFVLSVIGRNGAWVDGVWSGNGSKVGLGERSQIQIASRTFHFVLPPPPQPPEDSPSPSSQSSGPTLIDATMSGTRARSLSVDITSLSPPTSEHTPPPLRKPKDPPPSPKDHKPAPSAGKRKPAPANKKRKKAPQRPPTPPEVMPPKPTFTYAQLCYRAIKSLDGKATLQDICGWMMETFDWYRYNEGSGWENSVRHNLSSNRAFKKMERCAGERGKGFFWSVDPNFEHMFAEQASGSEKLASGGTGKKSKKAGASVLGPPMKRSVKGESNGGFLPPPLTHAPLAMKGIATTGATTYAAMVQRQPATLAAIKPEAEAAALLTTAQAKSAHALGVCAPPSTSLPAPTATTPASLPSLPRIPFVVAPLPPSFKSAPSSTSTASPSDPAPTAPPTTTISSGTGTGTAQLNPHESLVLHEGTLFLHPTIFADLTPEHLRALEALGVQKAIEVLKGHIVSYLREVGRRGGRGRGRGRRRGGARGGGPERGSAPGGVKVGDIVEESAAEGVTETANSNVGDEKVGCVPTAPTAPENGEVREESPIVVVDDDEEEEGRAVKRRKVEGRDVDVERKSVEGMEGVSATG